MHIVIFPLQLFASVESSFMMPVDFTISDNFLLLVYLNFTLSHMCHSILSLQSSIKSSKQRIKQSST